MRKSLRSFYLRRIRAIRKNFNRVVPFGDTVIDRWEKARLLNFGKNTSCYDSTLILGDVRVGENVWIGPGVVLDGSAAPLVIGSYCSISAGVQIYTHNSVGWAVSGGAQEYAAAPVAIGSYVYIGPLSVIQAGVTIGNHIIIGAYSLVKRDIEDLTAVWGQPASKRAKIILHDNGEYRLQYATARGLRA